MTPLSTRPGGQTAEVPVRRSKVLVVLPAYNEEANIGALLDRIDEAMVESGLDYHVIVVDDGSQDRTFEVLSEYSKRLPLTLSSHQVNQGLGQSPGHSYGGFKASGIGREFSLEGMLESYTQRKNVTINLTH